MLMNIANMNVCYAITYAKTVNIYWPGYKTDKYYWGGKKLSITFTRVMTHIWGNDSHTKGDTVNYLNGVTTNTRKKILSIILIGIMTNIRKKIPSIIFTGIMTNIRKKILSIILIGIMTNIRKKIPSIILIVIMTNIRKKISSIIFTGIMTNIRKWILSITFTGIMTNIRKWILGTWDLLIREKTCKLSVWLMKVCRKFTRFRKRFRQNPLGLVQDLRESARLLIKGLRESTRLSINICENPLGFW